MLLFKLEINMGRFVFYLSFGFVREIWRGFSMEISVWVKCIHPNVDSAWDFRPGFGVEILTLIQHGNPHMDSTFKQKAFLHRSNMRDSPGFIVVSM